MSILRTRRKLGAFVAAAWTAMLILTACSGQTQSVAGGDDPKSVTIGYVPFDEVIATSYLWKEILENQGYTVTLQQLDVAAVYQGVAQGQIDMYTGGVPITHKDYWKRFGSGFVKVGQWYDTLLQGLVVPSYTGLKTISDLEGKASMFNGQIVGIEAGSGLMNQTTKLLPKTYDMSGYKVREGSTPAMLAALDRAISRKDPIAVTLWTPHWAFDRYDLTLLEDDKGVYPPNDTFHVVTSKDFNKNKEVMQQIEEFHMTPDQLQGLELMITEAGEGKEQQAVRQWISENQHVVNSWTASARG